MSMSKQLFELVKADCVHKAICKLCGYVAISLSEKTAVELMRIHLRDTHNIRA